MSVTLRYHEDSEPGLEAWVASLPGHDPERRAMARLCLAALEQDLIASRGSLDGATPVPRLRPPVYWWRFHGGWWMRFCVEEVRRWFRPPEYRIVVLEVADRGPPVSRGVSRADG